MTMLMTVTVDRLRIRAFHGFLEQERRVGNEFEVTVSLCYEADEETLLSDSLDDTINYAEIVQVTRDVMRTPCRLIEKVCCLLRDELLQRFPAVTSGSVTVAKLLPPIAGARLDAASATLSW